MLNFRRTSKRKRTDRSKTIARADALFSKIIRARDGQCQWPGCQSKTIYTHHIFSRRYLRTRWDEENAISLCVYHHTFKAHGDPEQFRDFILNRIGAQRFTALKARAYMRAAPVTLQDIDLTILGLKQRAKGMDL